MPADRRTGAVRPICIDGGLERDPLDRLAQEAGSLDDDVAGALALAVRLGAELPVPGGGRTAQLWSALATLGAVDLTVARAVEPHLDAVAIHAEAGMDRPAGSWGVFAAERPGTVLAAADDREGSVRLTGVKPWCSLAGRLDHALVTAHDGDRRRLYAVDLHDRRIVVVAGDWHALGLAAIPSGELRFDAVVAEPVGAAGWYLQRPGFAWGGMGVAAVWFGGAVALARSMTTAARRREPDQIALAAIGRIGRDLHAAAAVLAAAARAVDDGAASGADGAALAAQVRGVVASAAESTLITVGHALGPAPLTLDAEHARRVADLTVYLRQHHAERDDAALGAAILRSGNEPW